MAPRRVLVLSARTPAALTVMAANLAEHLASHPETSPCEMLPGHCNRDETASRYDVLSLRPISRQRSPGFEGHRPLGKGPTCEVRP